MSEPASSEPLRVHDKLELPVPRDKAAFNTLYVGGALPNPNELRADPERLAALEALLETTTCLIGRQREVMNRVLGLAGHETETLQAVGDDLGVSKERVHVIVKQALRRLHKAGLPRASHL